MALNYITIQGSNDEDFSEFWIKDSDMPQIREMLRSKTIMSPMDEDTTEQIMHLLEPTGEWIG